MLWNSLIKIKKELQLWNQINYSNKKKYMKCSPVLKQKLNKYRSKLLVQRKPAMQFSQPRLHILLSQT